MALKVPLILSGRFNLPGFIFLLLCCQDHIFHDRWSSKIALHYIVIFSLVSEKLLVYSGHLSRIFSHNYLIGFLVFFLFFFCFFCFFLAMLSVSRFSFQRFLQCFCIVCIVCSVFLWQRSMFLFLSLIHFPIAS